jgi:hypothetical protein
MEIFTFPFKNFPSDFPEVHGTDLEYLLEGGYKEYVGMYYRINGGGLI